MQDISFEGELFGKSLGSSKSNDISYVSQLLLTFDYYARCEGWWLWNGVQRACLDKYRHPNEEQIRRSSSSNNEKAVGHSSRHALAEAEEFHCQRTRQRKQQQQQHNLYHHCHKLEKDQLNASTSKHLFPFCTMLIMAAALLKKHTMGWISDYGVLNRITSGAFLITLVVFVNVLPHISAG